MKNVRFWLLLGTLIPCGAFGAVGSDFQGAAQLLSAARRGDTRTVQYLISSGVDINYTDSTGLSLVCTAVMNNDKRAIQILQMYGADASNCDRQIKKYRQRKNIANNGEEYDFFSGLSSSHIVALSAVGVAAVIGGVALLTNAFDSENNNGSSSSGGSHGSGSGGSGGSSGTKGFSVPYSPAYIKNGVVTPSDTSKITDYLSDWGASGAYSADFNYMRQQESNNYIADGLYPELENYMLVMGGYYSLANGYMGNYIFRDSSNSPVDAAMQGRPVRVALITGNGINPAGSAASVVSGHGLTYALTASVNSATVHVDKYLNNESSLITGTVDNYELEEHTGFDLSGSGSAFNPFATPNESALAKIVAGWEAGGRANSDLYGFVPNGQLAIYRTGNGTVWSDVDDGASVGTFSDGSNADGVLSAGDTITLTGGETFEIKDAVQAGAVENPTITVNNTSYKLAPGVKMFLAECKTESGCSSSDNFAIYVGTDGYWYVNNTGGNDIDTVYAVNGTNVYVKKTQQNAVYYNFSAMQDAATKKYAVTGDSSTAQSTVDVIANTNVIPASRNNTYVTTNAFTKFMDMSSITDAKTAYMTLINTYYNNGVDTGNNQGGVANNLFLGYSSTKPIIVMPAGDYLSGTYVTKTDDPDNVLSLEWYWTTQEATFENYAPMLYSGLKHNFMTVVGVSHTGGTSAATSVDNYGDGTGSSYGKLQLSEWSVSEADSGTGNTTTNVYSSRMCGLAGVGDAENRIDPWCFAASGPTAEMATASAAGAVASVKSAFSYMDNDQIYTLLALTADGPYLNANTNGTKFTTDSLVEYLQNMYQLPLEYDISGLSSEEYLNLFKTVFGYGLINVQRAIKPGFSVYYYDGSTNNIVSTSGKTNRYWGKTTISSARASSALSLMGRSAIKTSFYDIVESPDGTMSLPRVWNSTIAMDGESRHGLYMGDVLDDFNVDSTNKRTNKIGNLTIDMAVSSRAYDDDMNGLDNMRIAWTNNTFDLATEYQHYLTNGESRFNGRANGLLNLVSDSISVDAMYKYGNFAFGGSAFIGAITDENLLDKDPVVSSQFEPGRLGFANGGALEAKYNSDKFGLNMSFGVMHENNTVLGMVSDGALALNGADTKYIDAVATYKPFENVKLSLRGTYAITDAVADGLLISDMSNIKSNSFAFGVDVGGFSFTAAMPLAVVDGEMAYGYADMEVVENDGKYEIAVNNAHTEYVDLSAVKRELRFTTTYKKSLGEWTDAGVGFVYRVNPNNTDAFGNESILMFKLHHRLGI